jgi:hypothetical protein
MATSARPGNSTTSADANGISLHSATRLVRRNAWRRQRDNRGHVLALVPIEALSRQSDMPSAIAESQPSAGSAEAHGDVTHLVGALEAAITATGERAQADAATIATLQASLASERGRADAAEAARGATDADRRAAIALADQTVALLTDAVARAERAEHDRDAERARADELRDRAQAATEAERRAEQAEQGREAARKRAYELANRLLVVQAAADRTEAEAGELRRQAEAAQIGQAEAEADAEELRQAEAARKGRGVLARLRAAWRGR